MKNIKRILMSIGLMTVAFIILYIGIVIGGNTATVELEGQKLNLIEMEKKIEKAKLDL
jgi:hypothetical protein